MNEDQVIGCIRGLQWALKFCSIPKHSRTKLYAQMDEQWARLALLRKEPKPQSVKPQSEPVAPPPPVSTPEQIAQREQKRQELEEKIWMRKARETLEVVKECYADQRVVSLPPQMRETAKPQVTIIPAAPAPYREPAYNEEPSDFRPLPHFGGRD